MKIKFSFFVGFAAALVAGCAAFFSVFGLSQLFAGASLAVIIMASSLEIGKIVSVSFLHRYWNRISKTLKIYLTVGVVILITITSAGIYGFLSNAYQKTANKLELSDAQLNVLTSKKDLFNKNITDNKDIIGIKTARLNQLNSLRSNQETRLDEAKNNSSRIKARQDIDVASKEIQKLSTEIDGLNQKNTILLDSVNFYASKAIETKANDNTSAEVGPLKYLAQLTGKPMDKVVNVFILLLIFVFDPLAVALVIATNKILSLDGKTNEVAIPESNPEPIEEISPVVESVEPEIEPVEAEPIEAQPEPVVVPKKEPVIPTGKIEVNDIKEKKTNRGFTQNIPSPKNNTIERIGSNKITKDGDQTKIFYNRKK